MFVCAHCYCYSALWFAFVTCVCHCVCVCVYVCFMLIYDRKSNPCEAIESVASSSKKELRFCLKQALRMCACVCVCAGELGACRISLRDTNKHVATGCVRVNAKARNECSIKFANLFSIFVVLDN